MSPDDPEKAMLDAWPETLEAATLRVSDQALRCACGR